MNNPDAKIVCIDGPMKGARSGFRHGTITIGRDADNNMTVNQYGVSRHHAEVHFNNGTYTLINLSMNGTFSSGRRVDRMELKKNGQFMIGKNIFALVVGNAALPRPTDHKTPPTVKAARSDHKQRASSHSQDNWENAYALGDQIAVGQQAIIYKATRRSDGQTVVLKVLHETLEEVQKDKFRQQIEIGKKIHHPYCAKILDGSIRAEVPWLVEEYLSGGTVSEKLARKNRFSLEETRQVVGEVCDALTYLHRQHHLYHRDICPENLMFGDDGHVRIIDFGLAHITGSTWRTIWGMGSMSRAQYLSPEQCNGDPVTAQSDMYSLGVVAYYMLSGRNPFDGVGYDVINDHLKTKPKSVRLLVPDIPPSVDNAILQALAKLPSDRFGTTQEMARAFGYTKPVHGSTASAPGKTTGNGLKLYNLTTGQALPTISAAPTILGRNELNPQDSVISKKQFKLDRVDNHWNISDLADNPSRNPTFLNGTEISAVKYQPLALGDKIKAGKTILEVVE